MAEVYLNSRLAEHFTEEQLLDWAWTVAGDIHRQVQGRCTLRTVIGGPRLLSEKTSRRGLG